MKRIILFSLPNKRNEQQLFKLMLPKKLRGNIFGYIPTNGRQDDPIYTTYWKQFAEQYGYQFSFIDNTVRDEAAIEEVRKIKKAAVVMIAGGDTFELLDNLRQSGLDQAIKDFVKQDEYVLAGFSAGAIVLSPTIAVAALPQGDDNTVGITDLTALGIIKFEVYPHYVEDELNILENYRQTVDHEVKALTDDDIFIIER